MPTLVVHGTADQMIPVENGRLIASLIPDSRLEIFDGVGHLFFWERPERSAELVREHAGAPRRELVSPCRRSPLTVTAAGVRLAGEESRRRARRSCCCTASPRRAATW